MNRLPISLLFFLPLISACSGPEPMEQAAATATYNIDRSRITVSGISAGAYMAGQYHIAHSSVVSGAGLIAGGPYHCAGGSMSQGLGPCMQGGDLAVSSLAEYAAQQSALGTIDDLNNLNDDRLWVFHGSKDDIIHSDVPTAAMEFYTLSADSINVVHVFDVAASHGMPTIVGNGPCNDVVSPFLNNCNYDAAGELLTSIAGLSEGRSEAPEGTLTSVSQPGAAEAEMLDEALLFVPTTCANGETCGLHIAFHGCQQSTEFVGNAFAAGAGYNEWASGNRLLVLYPQVARSRVAPLNPLGCWDWWGYTGEDYATQNGVQMAAVTALIDSLSDTER